MPATARGEMGMKGGKMPKEDAPAIPLLLDPFAQESVCTITVERRSD